MDTKGCGLRNFVPGARSSARTNLSGLKDESPSVWKSIENSVYVGESYNEIHSANECKTICDQDQRCATMIYNQSNEQCSINFGTGPFREIGPIPGVTSYKKCK